MKKQNFLQGALILVVASMIVKIFGAIFKIPLANIIGVEAMAYFNSAYGFYVIFYMISTAGIPVALSKMISEAEAKENKTEVKKIFRVSYILFFVLGAVGSLIMIIFSKQYSSYVHLEGLHFSIIAISTTLFFMCITSAYRGYFQGLKNMAPTAVSQVIGASGKLFIGLLVAYIATIKGASPHMTAAFTLLGITTGSIGSTLYLAVYKKICDKKDKTTPLTQKNSTSHKAILKKLVYIAVPITLSATILSLTNTIDTTLMIRRLTDGGFIREEATKIMGAYTSMSVPLNNLSPNLIYPFAISVMPAITSMFVSGKRDEASNVITSTFRITSIIAIPCSIGLSVFSKPIVSLLYTNDETITFNGKTVMATELAGEMLSVLAISIFFISMVSMTSAVLQVYGKERKTIISTSVGILLKIVLNYILIADSDFGIYGAPIATLVCYFVIMLLNFFFIIKYTEYKIHIGEIVLKPVFSAAIGIGISVIIYNFIASSSAKLSIFVALFTSVILYFFFIFLAKGVKAEDVRMLPKGKKIEKFLKNVKAVK